MDIKLESAKNYTGQTFNDTKPLKSAYQCRTVAFFDGIEVAWFPYKHFVSDFNDVLHGIKLFIAEKGLYKNGRLNVVRKYYAENKGDYIHFLSMDIQVTADYGKGKDKND
jgi:hypothetical protein